jgi:prepilin-type N-terminal cleavage/methylation domain-containing protein
MKSNVTWRGREGFTLIEVLVTLILLAILAAAVFPIVTQQAAAGDPVRTAQDLATLRNGILQFQLDDRPSFPSDLEDLVYRISVSNLPSGDKSLTNAVYSSTQATRWNGPYIDVTLTEDNAAIATGNATPTGYDAQIQKDLKCIDATPTAALSATNLHAAGACIAGTDYVSVQVTGLTDAQFREINRAVDGVAEPNPGGEDTGKLRFIDTNTNQALDTGEIVYYLAAPYR